MLRTCSVYNLLCVWVCSVCVWYIWVQVCVLAYFWVSVCLYVSRCLSISVCLSVASRCVSVYLRLGLGVCIHVWVCHCEMVCVCVCQPVCVSVYFHRPLYACGGWQKVFENPHPAVNHVSIHPFARIARQYKYFSLDEYSQLKVPFQGFLLTKFHCCF